MRILEMEEANQMLPVSNRGSRFLRALIGLKSGQALFIEREEWKRKHSPFYMARLLERKHGFVQYECVVVAGGWLIKRMK